jgi:hypothetical protein
MRRSVYSGTAKKAQLPNMPKVCGVAAMADYGQGKVSWFVGYQGDLAFAIAVEGNVDAATIAAKFLGPYKVPQVASASKPRVGKAGAGSTRPAGKTSPVTHQ